MADIKWIKLMVDMFDHRKIKQIESMPDADSVLIIWIKLMCLAGQINNDGLIVLTREVAYTDEMLAAEFDRPLNTVRLALSIFTKFGMIEIVNDIYCISNWEKYQNIEGMDKIREQNRIRKQNQRVRDRQKALTAGVSEQSHVTSRDSHATEEDKNKKEEEELELDNRDYLVKVPYQKIVDLWNRTTTTLPKVKALSNTRRIAIKRIWTETENSLEQIEKVFQQVQDSDFLTGRNGSWSMCGFDWVLKPANWQKVIEGNYQNKQNFKNTVHDTELPAWATAPMKELEDYMDMDTRFAKLELEEA